MVNVGMTVLLDAMDRMAEAEVVVDILSPGM